MTSLPLTAGGPARPPDAPTPAGRFVVVTGCHGVGKSTVAGALADGLGAAVLQYPMEFARFRERVGLDTEVPALPRLLYYLGATLHLSGMVQQQLARSPVVCDRYLESPVALLIAEAALDRADLDRSCRPFLPDLCRPDLTLVLTARYEVACRRIVGRGADRSATQRRMLGAPGFYRAYEAAVRAEAARLGPTAVLDTTDLGLDEMCASARALVASP